MNLEITVISTQTLPGYGNDEQVGPFEGIILKGITDVSPNLLTNNSIVHFNRNASNVFGCNNCVAITDTDNLKVLYLRPMGQVTSGGITSALEQILQLRYDLPSGNYINLDGEVVEHDTKKGLIDFFPGLGLSLGINLPPVGWWILSAIGGIGAWKSKNKTAKWGFGLLSGWALLNAKPKRI